MKPLSTYKHNYSKKYISQKIYKTSNDVYTMAVATAGGAIAGFFIFIFLIWIIGIGLGILALIFWIFMIVDVAKRKFKKENDKIMWVLIIVLTGIVGAAIYYFMIKRPEKH